MIKTILAALALGTAVSAAAQPSDPPAPAEAGAPDAATLRAAERFVTLIMPPGMLQRMFGAGSGLGMESMLEMRVGDFGLPEGSFDGADRNRSFAEVMEARDPHFRERMRITSEISSRIMGEVFATIEPDMRAAMAEMYARRFTAAELDELNNFFAQGPGQKFAQIAFTMMQDPVFTRLMRTMMPRFAEATPRILREVTAATAHLPPPLSGEDTGQEDQDDE
jgi:hypothetical protein